jgi:hypothetical protein
MLHLEFVYFELDFNAGVVRGQIFQRRKEAVIQDGALDDPVMPNQPSPLTSCGEGTSFATSMTGVIC